ncbi:MAG: T9SS type A sorting domain-containing protein [Bacteroidetes bacterium]|nr:T9SS type A sorting domain-containing protein [Bacteroidota bacterium]
MKKLIVFIVVFYVVNIANAQWQQTSMNNYSVRSLALHDSCLFAGTFAGIYRSLNNGTSWIPANNGLAYTDINTLSIKDSNIIAGAIRGVHLSTNNGSNWVDKTTGIDNDFIYASAFKDSNIFIASDAIYLSTDFGNTWVNKSIGQPTSCSMTSFTINGNNIFAGDYYNGVFLSQNNGNSWIHLNLGITSCYGVNALASVGNKIFAATVTNGVYLSVNNGSTWSAISNGLPTSYLAQTFAIYDNIIYLGTMGRGVFMSKDFGSNWTDINFGLSNLEIMSLAVNKDFLFAGTNNTGVWRRSLIEILDVKDGNFNQIINIYPNPVKDKLNIDLQDLKNLKNASLSIYDIQGKLLLNQYITQAKTEINIQYFTKGVYIVKVYTGNNVIVDKFIKE